MLEAIARRVSSLPTDVIVQELAADLGRNSGKLGRLQSYWALSRRFVDGLESSGEVKSSSTEQVCDKAVSDTLRFSLKLETVCRLIEGEEAPDLLWDAFQAMVSTTANTGVVVPVYCLNLLAETIRKVKEGRTLSQALAIVHHLSCNMSSSGGGAGVVLLTQTVLQAVEQRFLTGGVGLLVTAEKLSGSAEDPRLVLLRSFPMFREKVGETERERVLQIFTCSRGLGFSEEVDNAIEAMAAGLEFLRCGHDVATPTGRIMCSGGGCCATARHRGIYHVDVAARM